MPSITEELQEALGQLDAVRSAMADPLKRWSADPHRGENVREVVAALSDLMSREAVYQRLLQQAVLELLERVDSLARIVEKGIANQNAVPAGAPGGLQRLPSRGET